MNTNKKCSSCGSKTKDLVRCDKCGKLTCSDCATERADLNASWVCPSCNKKYKYKG